MVIKQSRVVSVMCTLQIKMILSTAAAAEFWNSVRKKKRSDSEVPTSLYYSRWPLPLLGE